MVISKYRIVIWGMLMYMATAVAMASPYVLEGFRSAKFGMNKNQVITAIKTDFGVEDADIIRDVNMDQGTDVLAVEQPGLSVFNGPTTIAYMFGHKTKKLIRVTVTIRGEATQDSDKVFFLNAAVNKLVPHFKQKDLSNYKVVGNVAVPKENAVLLFGLVPESEKYPQALEIALSNIAVRQKDNQVTVDILKASPEPITLQINYISALENMDIAKPIDSKDF